MDQNVLNEFLSKEGLVQYTSAIKEWVRRQGYITEETDTPKIVRVAERGALPSVGDAKTIYINTTTHQIYFWLEEYLKYQTFGSDYEDIRIIDGGKSK